VIPTRDRWSKLATTLAAVERNAGEAEPVEVVVVDDGSATPAPAPETSDVRLRWLRQPPRGPAAARNLGVAAATAHRVLLLGDDTRPAAGCLARHAVAGGGLQGRIDWDPARETTAIMRFLAPEGPQFWFRGLGAGVELAPTAILGANFSAPRRWFELEPFDETLTDAAFEDSELGWRFALRGWRSRFEPAARCWHDHVYDDLAPFLAKQRRAGRAARRAIARHPALAWRALARPAGVYLAKRAGLAPRPEPERSWERRCLEAYLDGLLFPGAGRGAPGGIGR